MQPISFTVRYGLAEYMSVVTDIAGTRGVRSRLGRALLWLVAPPIFLYKKSKVGDCRFTLTSEQLERKSKDGRKTVPWADVLRIHRLSRGYLVELAEGAMPLPYRCFGADQRSAFESFIETRPRPVAAAAP